VALANEHLDESAIHSTYEVIHLSHTYITMSSIHELFNASVCTICFSIFPLISTALVLISVMIGILAMCWIFFHNIMDNRVRVGVTLVRTGIPFDESLVH
jgi:hypothetical protein